jgi:lysophospholipase L1-like esterase
MNPVRSPIRTRAAARRITIGIAAVVLLVALSTTPFAQSSSERWIGTWSTSEVGRPQTPPPPIPEPPRLPVQCPAAPETGGARFQHVTNQTLRQIVHTTIGGSQVRVVLSNAYGPDPIPIGAAHIALRDGGPTIRAGSGRAVTFSGQSSFTIPPGAVVYSDPVRLAIPQMTDVAVDLYVPGTTKIGAITMHTGAAQTNYVSTAGNHAGATQLPVESTTQSWFVLYRLDVLTSDAIGAIVAFGDSITDGTRSTPDTNNRWPDVFARRLASHGGPLRLAVINAGIAGNRVLSNGAFSAGINALARFEHNVLAQPGVTHVIFMEGINDIGQGRENESPSADDIIAGHKQIIERAHSHGIKIFGATLTPFYAAGYYTEVGDQKRRAVNEWIRTSKAYDGAIDFDKATRDPNDPKRLLAAFDSCDHLHPNDAGYKAMADAIDPALFKPAPVRSSGRRH